MRNDKASYKKPYKSLLFSAEEVDKQIHRMAQEIVNTYSESPLFVSLMRGGVAFTAKLMMAITEVAPNFHPEVDYMTISSYTKDRQPTKPHVVMDLDPRSVVAGRDVVIVDDLVDKGGTLKFVTRHLTKRKPKSVASAVLVTKPSDPPSIKPEFVGFAGVDDVWLTGMGMDDEGIGPEANRWAEWIAISRDYPDK